MLTGLKILSLACNVYFTDQNIMQRGDSMELKFEGLEIQKVKYSYQWIELKE